MLDTSIPLSVQNLKMPDLLEIARQRQQNKTARLQEEALRLQNNNLQTQGKMGDLALLGAQRENKKALEDESKADTFKGLLQVNTETAPDGTPTVNHAQMVKDLVRLGRPQDAIDYQKKVQADRTAALAAKRAEYQERLGLRERILADHSPENYGSKLALLKSFGDDVEDLPPTYDKAAIDNSLKQVLTLKDRIAQSNKENEDKAKQDNDKAMRTQAAATLAETSRHNKATEAIENKKANQKDATGANLPIDVKEKIKALSTKNASKIAIANQIESSMAQLKAAKDEDTKVRIGRGMLKILNSTEGADAIGSEEAKRLGDALEYNLFDVSAGLGMKPGKLHGRDLAGFEKQSQAILDAIRSSVAANQGEIDKAYGRETSAAAPGESVAAHYDYVPGKGLVPVGGQ